MSLINEALKRTRDATYQPATAPPPPVVTGPRLTDKPSRRSVWVLVIGLIGLFIMLLAVGVVWQFLHQQPPRHAELISVTAVPPPVTPPREPPPRAAIEPVPPVEPALPAPAPVEPPPPVVVAPVAPPPPPPPAPLPEPPKLQLQGIVVQGNWREVMINGQSLREGEQIEGATILAITPREVKLNYRGREFSLRP